MFSVSGDNQRIEPNLPNGSARQIALSMRLVSTDLTNMPSREASEVMTSTTRTVSLG